MCKLANFIVVAVFVSVLTAATDAEAKKCPCKKSSKNSVEKEADRIRAEQKKFAENVRSLYEIVENQEIRTNLRVSEAQNEKLDELQRRYEEARSKIRNAPINPSNPQQRQQLERMKNEKLRELSLKAGLKVADILSKEQVNAYGRRVEMEKMRRKSR